MRSSDRSNVIDMAAERHRRARKVEEMRRNARWSLDPILGPPCWPLQDPAR